MQKRESVKVKENMSIEALLWTNGTRKVELINAEI